jgi:hypothetical protein|eukprot:COSAG02_NODE_5738_length_4078_cov_2.919326_3_plen_95_part_00
MPMLRLPQYMAAVLAATLALCRANTETCNVCDEPWAGGPGDGCHECDGDCGASTCPDNCSDCPEGREYMCKTFMVRSWGSLFCRPQCTAFVAGV